MKKLLLLLAAIAMALPTFAQDDSDGGTDTTEISVGKRTIIIVSNDDDEDKDVIVMDEEGETIESITVTDEDKKDKKNVKVDFVNLDLGMNYLIDGNSFGVSQENSMLENKPLNSTHFAIHLVKTRVNLIRHKVNLVTAITLDNNRFAFRDPIIVVPDQNSLTLIEDSVSYRKSKLISWHAQIPLLLNFQTSPNNEKRNFHISAGGYAGLMFHAKTKRKGDSIGKVKQQDDFNLNPVRYGVTGRIGYRGLELYCNYNLTSMFAEGEGPEIMPINFGISLTGMM